MTARRTQHWHGVRSVAGPVDEGGCCAGEAEWAACVWCGAWVPDGMHPCAERDYWLDIEDSNTEETQ